MDRIIGIDCGANGAIVQLDLKEQTAHYLKIPYRDDGLIDYRIIEESLMLHNAFFFVEKLHGRGGWSSSVTFKLGENYGKMLQCLSAYGFTLVEPQQWQKTAHDGTVMAKKPKDRTKEAFVRLQPHAGIKHDGVIDAFFIARYGLLKLKHREPVRWNFIDASK